MNRSSSYMFRSSGRGQVKVAAAKTGGNEIAVAPLGILRPLPYRRCSIFPRPVYCTLYAGWLLFQPPIVPRVRHVGDARNFHDYPEQNWQKWYELGAEVSTSFVLALPVSLSDTVTLIIAGLVAEKKVLYMQNKLRTLKCILNFATK